jgi:hypothetical protein
MRGRLRPCLRWPGDGRCVAPKPPRVTTQLHLAPDRSASALALKWGEQPAGRAAMPIEFKSAPVSNGQHDLADVTAGLHAPVCVGSVRQREGRIDNHLHPAI